MTQGQDTYFDSIDIKMIDVNRAISEIPNKWYKAIIYILVCTVIYPAWLERIILLRQQTVNWNTDGLGYWRTHGSQDLDDRIANRLHWSLCSVNFNFEEQYIWYIWINPVSDAYLLQIKA